jgi:hypothetical protein
MEKPKCTQCRHYYITWDPKIPNGCRRFGIQCKDQPSRIVAQAGEGECQGYEAKVKKDEKKKEMDLNRPEYW